MAQAIEALDNLIREGKSKRMAKMTGLIKTIMLKRKTAKKKNILAEWLKHRKKAGKHAMGLAQWKKEGRMPTYFKGMQKRKSPDAILRELKGK